MRLVVDDSRCQGHAQCWGIAPHLFDLDELGFSHAAASSLPAEDRPLAERAVLACPERAITVEE